MEITYKLNITPDLNQILDVYKSSGINRPVEDPDRIAQMYAHSNLIATSWHDYQLIGIARSLTDFCYCCYLSDLAVDSNYQKQGVGKKLIELTKERIGNQCMLLLLSAPQAMGYYPKVGFEPVTNGFIIKRQQ